MSKVLDIAVLIVLAGVASMAIILFHTNRHWIKKNYPPQDLLDRVDRLEREVFR